ncbi:MULTISPECIES: DUF6481 family protein [Methylobacterium]|uniref:DUF6481 family protein n=1 Tax=Methylobacterium TaxID=407 RepID=UPI0019D07807|nr:DUF6481 family protein [Methylobacterium sp. DB0501]
MGKFKEAPLGDRLGSAAAARQAMLGRFQARDTTNDPALLARRAEREAVAAARTVRLAEREAERAAQEAVRLARESEAKAEQARQDEIAAAEATERAAEAVQAAETRLADQKAARDARYAARKARQRG